MRVIYFLKMFKMNRNFQNAKKKKKKEKKSFVSEVIASEDVAKSSQLRRQYLSSGVNMLTDSPKTLRITKRHFFQVNCVRSDQ